ncbi:MAG: HEPN domain-containing protein [Candidatus Dormibacteraeota bacterium]|nr:HEPN domain-containing protein [Candidatus Dormibacteraeota bacterium]
MEHIAALVAPLRAFVERVVLQINQSGIPQRMVWVYEWSEGGSSGSSRLESDPAATLPIFSMVWSAWPEYQPLRPAVEATPRLYAVLGTERWRKDNFELDQFLYGFLEDYLTEARNVVGLWDEAIFDRLCFNLAASVERKGYSLGAWAVLQHVEVRPPSHQLELIPNYYVVEPDPYRRSQLQSPLEGSQHWAHPQRYYLKTRVVQAYDQPMNSAHPDPDFNRCATAIRLAVGGDARIGVTAYLPDEPGEYRQMGGGRMFLGEPRAFLYGKISVLTPDVVRNIESYVRLLPALDPTHEIALRRFNQTAERVGGDDKLVDATIGLENLLLPGVDEELGFHFALRGAWILAAQDTKLRRSVYSDLKRIYKTRSQVVHASTKTQKYLTPEVIDGAIEYLRQLLRMIVTEGASRQSWRERLEMSVLDGSQRHSDSGSPPSAVLK